MADKVREIIEQVRIEVMPRRGLSRDEAARLLRIAPNEFDFMRRRGKIPPPLFIAGTEIWDGSDLRIAPVFTYPVAPEIGVYVIGFATFVKIGFSTNISRRLTQIQESLPLLLELHATLQGDTRHEKALHTRFRKYRTRGEWFRRESDLADWIAAGCPV